MVEREKHLSRAGGGLSALLLALLGMALAAAVGGCRRQPSAPSPDLPLPPPAAVPATESQVASPPQTDVRPEPDRADVALEAPEVAPFEAASQPERLPELADLTVTLTPSQLDVMRDTQVRLRAEWSGVEAAEVECRWDPGDRSGVREGCDINHRFVGGMSDRTVSLEVRFQGRKVHVESRPLPLERLPVVELPVDPGLMPAAGPDRRRLLFAAFHEAPDKENLARLVADAGALEPDLAVVALHRPANGALISSLRELGGRLGFPLLPVFCGGADTSLPPWRDDRLLAHGSDSEAPWRHSVLAGELLIVLLDPRVEGISLEQEKWLGDQLTKGGIAAHRLVFSCRPLESLSAVPGAELIPQFRYYEKLLRGDVSLLATAGEPVYYHGSYGDLNTVSIGCAAGEPGRLQGSQERQEQLWTIADLRAGQPVELHAVAVGQPERKLNPLSFPAQVGNYRRWR